MEERERAFKKARIEREEEEVRRWADTERIMEEGRRMREERERELRMREEEAKRAVKVEVEEEDPPPELGTPLLRFPSSPPTNSSFLLLSQAR